MVKVWLSVVPFLTINVAPLSTLPESTFWAGPPSGVTATPQVPAQGGGGALLGPESLDNGLSDWHANPKIARNATAPSRLKGA